MHEDFLRHIWSRQLFDAGRLVTTDGRSVRIISPGILSRTSGPDFRDASVMINGTVYRGDIEFHRRIDDWHLHQHHRDPKYNSVILHVVLSGTAGTTPARSGRVIPTVILEPFLFSPAGSIEDHLSREEYASKKNAIPCTEINDPVPPELLQQWMTDLYKERLNGKIQRLHDRLRQILTEQQPFLSEPVPPYDAVIDEIPFPSGTVRIEQYQRRIGWEQLLYEEVMDCFGYSQNRTPMKRLAENVSLIQLAGISHRSASSANDNNGLTPLQFEAILFTASGLLPDIHDVHDQDSKVYIHSLHAVWNDLPKKTALSPLHRTAWIFSPTRPANFPTIRIAAASAFLFSMMSRSLFKSIITVIEGKFSTVQSKIAQLNALLKCDDHPFWNFHYSFSEAVHDHHIVLGASRINDILVNSIIPFACLYGTIFGKKGITENSLNIAAELPLLDENTIIRTMNRHLIKNKIPLQAAYQQQGLIQLYSRYCSAGRCEACRIGKGLSDQ